MSATLAYYENGEVGDIVLGLFGVKMVRDRVVAPAGPVSAIGHMDENGFGLVFKAEAVIENLDEVLAIVADEPSLVEFFTEVEPGEEYFIG